MSAPFRAAAVGLRTSDDIDANVASAEALIREAASGGAQFVATPEMTALFEYAGGPLFAKTAREEDDRALRRFRTLAAELRIHLLIGSLAIRVAEERCANRSFLIAPDGAVTARYDKIHMFDVDLPGGERYRESKTYRPGDAAVIADLPWLRLGLSICYDLRFPHLYRALAKAGSGLIAVPAAFTETTGKAHWHVLLRARAIETGCFVIAPAQGGLHANGRATYGHSLIIGPWGEVLAEGGVEPGVIFADIDPAAVGEARGRVPALTHDRGFTGP